MVPSQALAAFQQQDGLPTSALGLLVHLAAELTQLPLILKVLCIAGSMATWLGNGVITRSTSDANEISSFGLVGIWLGQMALKNGQREALQGGLQGAPFLSNRLVIRVEFLGVC